MVLLTSAPYLINFWSAPQGYHYTWILPPYPEDSFGYMAWAQQAAHGAWLFKIKYTALPHTPFLLHPLFLICGWLSALFSCEIGIVFWAIKAIGVVLFFLVLYRYLDYLGSNPGQSAVASILVGISSGVGAITTWLGYVRGSAAPPADLWMPEVSTFWSLLWNPLFPFSLGLMTMSIFLLDRGTRDSRFGDLWLSGLTAGTLALLHPYALPLLFTWSTVVTIARKRWKAPPYLFRYFMTVLPATIYLVALSRLDPLVSRHSEIGVMKSPPVFSYISGFGLPLLVFLGGIIAMRDQLLRKYWHLVLWFFLAILFAYLPFWFQRKLVVGAHIPLCILSAIILDSAVTRMFDRRNRKWAWIGTGVLLLPFCASTSLYLLVDGFKQVGANKDGAYFVSDEIVDALKILHQQSRPDEIVFATQQTSRLIPALSGNTVVWGHWAMSVDRKEREAAIAESIGIGSFKSSESRAVDFWNSGIEYIFADGELKRYVEMHPFVWGAILHDTRKIFENESVVIYRHEPSREVPNEGAK